MSIDVSIIIPVYNRKVFVIDALRSATTQTHTSCQVIVIDDGSRPPLKDLITSVGTHIEYIYQDHYGLAIARNNALHNAEGEFVVFLDSDDLLSEQTIAIRIKHLRRHRAASCVYSRWTLINEYGTYLKSDGEDLKDNILPILLYTNIAPLHAFMFRTAAVRQCQGFNESLESCSDWDLLLRLALSQHTFSYVSDIGAFYRIHSETMSNDVKTMLKSSIQVIDHAFSDCRVQTRWQFLRYVAHALQFFNATAVLLEIGLTNDRAWLRLASRALVSVINEKTTPTCIKIEIERLIEFLSASRLHTSPVLRAKHKRLRDSVRAWVRGKALKS